MSSTSPSSLTPNKARTKLSQARMTAYLEESHSIALVDKERFSQTVRKELPDQWNPDCPSQ